jgi:diphosphomevalonate decarboxylase
MNLEPRSAVAHPNIAFIKYWGNIDSSLRLPANGSISMTLAALETKTTVEFSENLPSDHVVINGAEAKGQSYSRVTQHLDRIRTLSGLKMMADVTSQSNFPLSTGLASSASGFAALTLAASKAADLDLPLRDLSILARKASGSACRSIFGGFVEWYASKEDAGSYAEQIMDQSYWNLMDVIAIVREDEKEVSSTSGHAVADSSPLQNGRVQDTVRRLADCRQAILDRNFNRLALVVESDSNMMHSVMLTSTPPIHYWEPATITIMRNIVKWRGEGLEVCYTIDAGPNVHCICTAESALEIEKRLRKLSGVKRILTSGVGGSARVI